MDQFSPAQIFRAAVRAFGSREWTQSEALCRQLVAAVAVGAAVVTLPDEFHRTRWCAAINRRLGLDRLIATAPQDYVIKAIEVAGNAELLQSVRRQILDAGAELFEDTSVVREHEARTVS
ncbi:MAG: hypothetical protein HY000_39905 [Planctomycetes bacterium]|nr:hypothetical protein [Planctomycetota bacterium]